MAAIWKTPVSVDTLNSNNRDTINAHLGIEYTEVGEDYISAKMPADHRTFQPMGIIHGGAYVVLAESLGSVACNLCLDLSKEYAVGLDVNSNHIRSTRSGWVYGTARPIHQGRSTQVWEIRITNEEGKLVNITRLTMIVMGGERQKERFG